MNSLTNFDALQESVMEMHGRLLGVEDFNIEVCERHNYTYSPADQKRGDPPRGFYEVSWSQDGEQKRVLLRMWFTEEFIPPTPFEAVLGVTARSRWTPQPEHEVIERVKKVVETGHEEDRPKYPYEAGYRKDEPHDPHQ